MQNIIVNIQNESTWFAGLDKADMLGVIGFLISALLLLICLIRCIVWLIHKLIKPALDIQFKLENVQYEVFKKKGYITYDLYALNHGHRPVDIQRAGVYFSDGSEQTIYQEPHVIKTPDKSHLEPGEEAFYNDCDLFYTLNARPPFYKKIDGFFVDIRGYHRFKKETDVHALLNDLTIRASLTDKKGMNGF